MFARFDEWLGDPGYVGSGFFAAMIGVGMSIGAVLLAVTHWLWRDNPGGLILAGMPVAFTVLVAASDTHEALKRRRAGDKSC